ncbi:hypothetical protein GCM10029978_055580 [Actinoallomurus acanthiterrae]
MPSISPRTAVAARVTGLTPVNAWSHPGIVRVGTKTFAPKASTNCPIALSICAVAGVFTSIASAVQIQARLKANAWRNSSARSTPTGPPCGRKPKASPIPSGSTEAVRYRKTSPHIAPRSTDGRQIGRTRNRSNAPVVRSRFSVIPVWAVARTTASTMIPGSRYCR